MRLDQFIQLTCFVSRREAKQILKTKKVNVNNKVVLQGRLIICPQTDIVFYDGQQLIYNGVLRYFILNKPSNYVCSHQDDSYPSIFRLLKEEFQPYKLHVAGRLDADTSGLVLLTDDGDWSHRITHPSSQCIKSYQVWLRDKISAESISIIEKGVLLHGEAKLTLPAKVKQLNDFLIELTITEGKYHQVKRMIAAVGNHVVKLYRYQIGNIILNDLSEGSYRSMTEDEVKGILK